MDLAANSVLVVASIFMAVRLGRRYAARRSPVNLWYAVGLAFTALASFCDLFSHLLGVAPPVFYALYWIAASALVGCLGVGSAYLAHRTFGAIYRWVTILLTVWLTVAVFATLHLGGEGLALTPNLFTVAPNATIKLPFVLQSALGGTIIFVGALWSAVRFRSWPALVIAVGAAVFSSGGTVAGWLHNALGIFYWTQTVGIALLWWGVERSMAPRQPQTGTGGRAAS